MAFKTIVRFLVALTALFSFSANSDIVTHNLTGTIVTPGDYFGETGTGSFSYDDALITGVELESIDSFSSLSVDFTIFGQTFNENDDLSGSPTLTFNNGAPIHLDFLISEIPEPPDDINAIDINEPGLITIDVFDPPSGNLRPVTDGFEVDVSIEAVPVPAAVWLFGSGLIGLIGIARKNKKS